MENVPDAHEPIRDTAYYESRKCETLLRCGFPQKELWLTELTSSLDAIGFYGIDSEIAEIIDQCGDSPFVLYYHESGSVHCAYPFATPEEFELACQAMARYFGVDSDTSGDNGR